MLLCPMNLTVNIGFNKKKLNNKVVVLKISCNKVRT